VRKAFVTGGGSGIGRASALRLAEKGHAVAVMDLDPEAGERVAQEIRAGGGTAEAFAGDVREEAAVAAAIEGAAAAFGGLDAAVTCAGIESYGRVVDMDLTDWDRTLAINLTGTMLVARHAVPLLVESRGAFVAISSDVGVKAAVDFTPYNVSKHAVIGLVRSIAVDYGPQGVRANAVCPALTETPMAERIRALGKEEDASWADSVPLGRFASPREIANVVCHLASEEASYTNGHAYLVDGGLTVGF
jgi:meso-butanediol dehydrogenase/(S,S)-butanediol dehydrogenase/diacetyl reductase